MKRQLKKMMDSNFFRSIYILASGSIVAQIITLISSPITTRLFTPEEIGVFTLVTSAVAMFSTILSFRYEFIIVTIENERKMFAIIKLSIILCIIMSFLVGIGYFFFYLFFGKIDTSPFIMAVFVTSLLLISGFINIITCFNNRFKEYKLMTSVYVLRNFWQNAFMVILGLLKTGSIGLILSQIIGQLLGLKKQSCKMLAKWELIKSIRREEIIEVLKEYKSQPLQLAPSSFLSSFAYSSINYFISILFGEAILGLYSLSYRMLGLPLTLISNNVSRVFFESASQEYRETGCFIKSFKKTFYFMLCIGIVMLIGLQLLSVPIFTIVFGSKWRDAGVYVQILAPLFSIRLISNTVAMGVIVSNEQKFDLIIQILLGSLGIIDFIICYIFGYNIMIFLSFYSIIGTLIYLYYMYNIYCFAKKTRRSV